MKQTKKSFTYWLEVAALGIVLGLILQGAKAWTEPTTAPPGGNVGAPINTGNNFQWKGSGSSPDAWLGLTGGLDAAALKIHGSSRPDGSIMPGDVLTAQPDPADPTKSNGIVAWAPPTGGTPGGYTTSGFCQEVSDAGGCYFCKEGQIITEGPCAGRSDIYHNPVEASISTAYCGDDGRCKCGHGTLFLTRDDTGWPTNPYMGNWKPLFEYECHIPVSH